MKDEVFREVKKLSKKYNKKEILIFKMIEKCQELGFNIEETKQLINEFLTKK